MEACFIFHCRCDDDAQTVFIFCEQISGDHSEKHSMILTMRCPRWECGRDWILLSSSLSIAIVCSDRSQLAIFFMFSEYLLRWSSVMFVLPCARVVDSVS